MQTQLVSARQQFAHRIKTLRQDKNLSQEALASLCGLHRTYIGSVERGERNISVDNMEKIAVALGYSLQIVIEKEDVKR